MHALQIAQAALLLDDLLALRCARAVDTSRLDEADDLVQLAAIEKRAVSLADVDDRARDLPKVDAVHHLPAARARPVAHRRQSRLRLCGLTRAVQHRRLRFAAGADPLERRGFDPRALAAPALEEIGIAHARPGHLSLAGRAPHRSSVARLGTAARGTAVLAEGGALEDQAKAGGTADACQPCAAVLT